MTDYYAPANWDGIAERDGCVVVVDVSPTNRWVLHRSGSRTSATTAGHVEWPTFRPNPERRLWHVEKDARILDSGIGLGPCADYDRNRAATAVNRIVDRIEAAVRRREGNETPGAAATANADGVIIRRNLQRAGIEVSFPAKPDETVRAGLKRLGFRWSRRQELWYARYSESLWRRAHEVLGVALDPEPGDEPQNAGPVTGAEAPPEKDLPDTLDGIIAEALELDAVIQASDSGFPKEVADRMNELRGAAFRLDPDVDLDAETRRRRAYDAPKLVRQWKDLTQRLERGHGMRSNSRAAATTKHAHLGQLAQSRDQVQDALRIAVRQAQERGEAIPAAIRAGPDLARILLDEPETEAIPAATLHGTGVGLDWPVPLYARKELHRRGWKPLYSEDEAGKTEAWLCPEGQEYSQVIAEVYGLKPDDEAPFVRVFTWPRLAAIAEPGPPSRIVIRRAEIEWSPDGHLQARDLDSGEIYVPHSP
ncbi:MAG: hypothetical protein JXA67_14715, partial [Micromonosporaceae bacterium]|nr:hypothetical protein [Micromonosporaceae bacterium]